MHKGPEHTLNPSKHPFFFRLFIICRLYLLGSLDFLSFNHNLLTASAWQCSTFCCGWSCSWNWQPGTFYCGWKSGWKCLELSTVAESVSLELSTLAESAQPGSFYCSWKCSAWNRLLWPTFSQGSPSMSTRMRISSGMARAGWVSFSWMATWNNSTQTFVNGRAWVTKRANHPSKQAASHSSWSHLNH